MGLRPLGAEPIFVADDRAGAELALRAHLFDTRRAEVLAVLPAGEEPAVELAAFVSEHVAGALDTAFHPLEAAARLVQEDLTIVRPAPQGHVLVAGAVCFPSGWYLREKLGRPLMGVHDPIEGYAEEIGARVERFFERLEPDRPFRRRNWFLYDDPSLFQPWDPTNEVVVTAANAGQRVFIRSEREVMLRLSGTGAIVFTIRTQQVRLASLRTRPDVAAAMASYLRESPGAVHRLKGVAPYLAEVLSALDEMAA